MRIKKKPGFWARDYQFKLKGKLTKHLGYGCCTVHNFKWRERWKEALKEVHQDS